jgi:hypothetical protein
MKFNKTLMMIAAATLMISGSAYAIDGPMGPTSTSVMDVHMQIGGQVQMTLGEGGVVVFESYDGTQKTETANNVCLFSNLERNDGTRPQVGLIASSTNVDAGGDLFTMPNLADPQAAAATFSIQIDGIDLRPNENVMLQGSSNPGCVNAAGDLEESAITVTMGAGQQLTQGAYLSSVSYELFPM